MAQPQKVSRMSLSDSGACDLGFPAGQELVLSVGSFFVRCHRVLALHEVFSTARIPCVILEKWGDPWGTSLQAVHFSFLVEQSMGTSLPWQRDLWRGFVSALKCARGVERSCLCLLAQHSCCRPCPLSVEGLALGRSWKEMCPACQVGVWSAGAGSCRDIHHPAQLAAGEVSEGNSFLSPLTWAGGELLTWR